MLVEDPELDVEAIFLENKRGKKKKKKSSWEGSNPEFYPVTSPPQPSPSPPFSVIKLARFASLKNKYFRGFANHNTVKVMDKSNHECLYLTQR